MSFRVHQSVAEALTFVPHASAMTVAATTDTTRATLKELSVMTITVGAGVPRGSASEHSHYRRCIAKAVEEAGVFTWTNSSSWSSDYMGRDTSRLVWLDW